MFNFYKIINSHSLSKYYCPHIPFIYHATRGSANIPVSLTAVKFFDKPPADAVCMFKINWASPCSWLALSPGTRRVQRLDSC